MSHLNRLDKTMKISISPDDDGYIGRECPISDCEGYFKITLGTGLPVSTDCYCPYCGHKGSQQDFFTKNQIEYAKSVAIRKVKDALVKDLKEMEFEHKPKGSFGIGLSLKIKPGQPHPIHWYREKELETHITCSNCTLKYAVYGVFAYCPDCGEPNTLQIFHENLKLVRKCIEISKTLEKEVAQILIEDAFENCISSFDGFGRELCRINSNKSKIPERAIKISFQNLQGANTNVKELFGFELDKGLTSAEWHIAIISFLKRHLLAHKMGIIDDEYLRKSGDSNAIVGRKINISSDDVLIVIPLVEKLAVFLVDSLSKINNP
jgi:hypothetical protein